MQVRQDGVLIEELNADDQIFLLLVSLLFGQLLKVRVVSLYLLYGLYNYLPIQQNPFLCFLVDLYTTALHDDHLKPERFVTSFILNGDGEEVGAEA